MPSLLLSPFSSQIRAMLIDVAEPPPRPHRILRRRSPLSCSWLLGSERFLSPYIGRHISIENVFRFTLCAGNHNSLKIAPIVLAKEGKSSVTSKGLCDIVWTVEAELEDDQLLYVTGDPIVLGCWKPEMAILMSPTEHANLWKAEVKIASGVNFKYNYLIKGEKWPTCDIIWRPGPVSSLSVPLPANQDRKITVRDSWLRFSNERSPAHSWGSWIEETYLPILPLISPQPRDEFVSDKFLESDSTESDPLLNDLTIKQASYSTVDSVLHEGSKYVRFSSERDQPVEEPWLPHFSLSYPTSKDKMESGENSGNIPDEETGFNLHNQQHYKVTENLFPEEVTGLTSEGDSVSTTILINSSICTMQRIALLEDGKFVELLLEPVKTNVQCDSVYLGVVTKLVPHMGGAFVNIGNTRPSLMDIKQNREPFIFPPFRQRKRKKEINGSLFEGLKENQGTDDNEHSAFGDVSIIDDVTEVDTQDDPSQLMHDDYEEHEVEDDYDVSEVLKENLNGGIVDYGGEEADFEDYMDGSDQHLDGEVVDGSLPLDVEGAKNFHFSPVQDNKGSRILSSDGNKWVQVQKGTKIVVQVVKEGLGTKGPTLTAYPKLKSRFWILISRCDRVGVSKKISGVERTRLKVIAKTLQPRGFGLTVRTVAASHSLDELQKDLEGLLSTWKNIMEHAKSAALAADEGVEGAVPVILHRAMGQTLSVVQDYFNEKVKRMVVDSPRTYHEVTSYLQEMAPDLCDRVELYNKSNPLFDEFNIEEEINNILSKRVPLANGGSLVIEQTEALVSIDVNGGHGMFGNVTSQQNAILEVNLAAAKQIARELRLRDIGGIIVVDFIDMADESNKRLVYEEVKKAVERDRSMVKVSELSRHGLMEITRKRVRPSVTFMISEPCSCCHASGRVEALENSFSKIEKEICRLLATMDQRADPENPKSWPKFILRLDHHMSNYLTSGKRTRLAILSSSLKVWIILKVARGFTRGSFEVKPFTDDKANKNQQHVAISMLRPTESRNNCSGKKVTLFPVKKWKTGGK